MTNKNKGNSLGYAIGRTNWYMRNLINKLLREEGLNITNEQWIVLKVINEIPGLSQTEIAEKSLKDKTNITRILDLLEKSMFIERHKDDRDRRMYRIYITEQGKKILKAVNPITQKTDDISRHSLNKNEVTRLLESLDAICMTIKGKL